MVRSPGTDVDDEPWDWEDEGDLPMSWWVRGSLIFVLVMIVTVLSLAWLLNPYNEDGTAKRYGTHTTRPLNLAPCTFKEKTKLPCPSCGMTTSFSLLMHGDVVNSLRANAAGTLLCAFSALLVPWLAVSAFRGRTLFIRNLGWASTVLVLSFMALTLARWGIVLVMGWY